MRRQFSLCEICESLCRVELRNAESLVAIDGCFLVEGSRVSCRCGALLWSVPQSGLAGLRHFSPVMLGRTAFLAVANSALCSRS